LTVRESNSGKKKVMKSGNRMRCRCKQTIFKKFLSAFCVRSSMFEEQPYRNSFKSCHQLPAKKVEEKMSEKVNVECDTDENFKDDQGFFTVFPAIMFRFKLTAKFLHQNVFFHQN
jgi:hypothetical protein